MGNTLPIGVAYRDQDIAVWNRSGGALSEAVEINYTVIRNFTE